MSRKKKIILCLAAAAAAAAVIGLQAGLSFAAEGADWDDLRRTVEAGGSYTLTGDIHAAYDGTVHVPGNAEIDLAGHELVIDGKRDDQSDMFSVTGTLKVRSSADSGTLSANTGRSVIGIDGGNVELDRVYLHGYKTDHIVYNDGGSLTSDGGKLFGLTTGNGDGGGICLVNGAQGDVRSSVISRLEGQYGGGAYVDENSELTLGKDVLIENCYAGQEGGAVYWEYMEAAGKPQVPAAARDCSAQEAGDGIHLVQFSYWTMLKRTVNAGMTYTLPQDITGEETADAAQIMMVTGSAGIDLNGHTLTIRNASSAPVIGVADIGQLTVTDSKGTGAIHLESKACLVENSGTFVLNGTEITADGAVPSFLINHGDATVTDAILNGQNQTNNCIINESTDGNLAKSELTVNGTSVIRGGAAKATGANRGAGIRSSGANAAVTLADLAKIEDCTASGNGGGISMDDGTLSLSGSSVISECTAQHGGGISQKNGTAELSDSVSITDCSASGAGGAINNDHGAATLSGSVSVTACTAPSGGGIYNNYGTTELLGSVSITACTANYGGGIDNNYGTTELLGSVSITESSADYDGGGIRNNYGTVKLSESASITGDSASQHGGGIFNDHGTTELSGSASVTGCSAGENGGGIYATNGPTYVSGFATITRCSASYRGGGMYSLGWTGIREVGDQAKITECSAQEGGGIFNLYANLTVDGEAAIFKCTASSYGGGIMTWDGRAAMSGSAAVQSCTSENRAGGVCIWGSEATFEMKDNTKITDCHAKTDDGGGIFNNDGTNTISGSAAITECSSGSRGGGITNWGATATTTMGGSSTISGCLAAKYGGGIFNMNGTTSLVESSLITGCSAGKSGGGVYRNNGGIYIYSPFAITGNTPNDFENDQVTFG